VFHVPVEGDAQALWEQIKSARPRPTAVFVSNDELAVQLVQAVHRDGGRVPADLAVVAIGLTWIGRFSEVPITYVDQNRAELARVVVARLLERMEHPEAPPQHILVKPFLVERESSQKRG
jgi:LacI family transcriptional regulator